ncbi:MAG: C69 family dipeptidase [Synergistaceae bacterium]|nr:C69 family dipeptidase [Synergistaceae bacterium]
MKYSKMFNKRVFAFLVLAFYLLSPVTSWACTSMIVGKNASTTGRVLFMRTEDSQPNNSKKFIVVPAGFYKAGVNYKLLANSNFEWTFSHDSYKFTAVPDTTRSSAGVIGSETSSKDLLPHWEDGYHFAFDAAGINEKGFAVTATTTTGFRSGTGITTGTQLWTEQTMAKVLLAEAANCREAMDVVDKLLSLDVGTNLGWQGMANEMIHMADQNEAWILEAVGRYHYVASRVPDDCFSVSANAMQHQFFDENDPVNFRSNFKPVTYAEDRGIARYQYDDNGVKRVNISLTYGPTSISGVNGEANTYRRWRGMSVFAPSLGLNVLTEGDYYGGGRTAATSSDIAKTYPTYVKPDKKISPMDVAWLQRDRYAGTPFDQTYSPQYLNSNNGEVREGTTAAGIVTILPPGSSAPTPTAANAAAIRTIGYFTQQFTHVSDIGSGGGIPPEIGGRMFIAMAASETSVNIPFYGNITDTHPRHKFNITAVNSATTGNGINTVPPYEPNSAYSIFAHLGYLARGDRKNYVAPIKAFWSNYEKKLNEDQDSVIEPELLRLYNDVSPAASAKFATDYLIAISDRAFRAAEKIHDALVLHMATAPNTLFKIPAELLEETVNDSALLNPNAGDVKAAGLAQSGLGLLTRDDGNVKITTVPAMAVVTVVGAPKCSLGVKAEITLKPEQVAAKQTAAKLLYETELSGIEFSKFGGLDNFMKRVTFNIANQGGGSLGVTLSDAIEKGIATVTLTSGGAIVALEYILADGPGNSGFYNDKLVYFDGTTDGVLNGTVWTFTPTTYTAPGDCHEHGCNAGLGFIVLLLGIIPFVLRRK